MNIKARKSVAFDVANVLVDILIIALSFFLIANIWSGMYVSSGSIVLCIVFGACLLLMFHIYELYTTTIRKRYELVLTVAISCVVGMALMLLVKVLFWDAFKEVKNFSLILAAAVSCLLLMVWKLLLARMVTRLETSPKLLVIESNKVEDDFARKIKYSYAECYEAWYLLIDVEDHSAIDDIIDNKYKEYDGVFVTSNIPNPIKDELISAAVEQDKEIYVLPDLYNISVMRNEIVQFDDTPALRIRSFRLTRGQEFFKRAFDVAVSLVGVVLSSPIMLACCIAIKLDSKGPVVYKQERLTKDRKKFDIYKFRTMVNNAEKVSGAMLSTDDDPRITKVGRVLRSLRIDELPQLLNIFLGTMSIVGPRPERPVFVEQFEREIENYDKRFLVKAGLTGLAQVYARYNTNARDKTLYDLLYIKEYSFWLDIKLILRTVKTMFVKESSEGVKEAVDYRRQNAEMK